MTEDNAKKKLTLSGKSTLTLKLGATTKSSNSDGKKMVQVEVRKKRIIGQPAENKVQKPQIDEETAAKLKLIAEAKEFDNKRRQEEEERNVQRQKIKEEELKKQQEARQKALEQAKKDAKARRQASQNAIQAEKNYWKSLINK